MTHEQMFGFAKWIDCPEEAEAPVFRKSFTASAGEKSEIIICGLGWVEVKINGRRVSDDLLVPNASNYSYRDASKWNYPLYDDFSFRTYVLKYDISGYLIDGENILTVMLGGGYYHQTLYKAEGNVNYGTPKLCFRICKESGDVVSDSSVLCHKGYFRRCNLYYGEFQDYSVYPENYEKPEFDCKGFCSSREIEAPDTDFYFQFAPADKIIETIDDIHFIGEKDGKKYYDIGINTVGRAVLKCKTKGAKIAVSYAEEIGGGYHNGIHFNSEGRYRDEFITDGTDREYHSLFSWQGFRYLCVEGEAEVVRVEVIHSDCPVTSSFTSDNKVLNWLYETYIHTQLCNMHSGVPSDCPHRERLGYTGDGQLCCESGMLMFDSKDFYRKWLYDISDCQCKKSGHIQHTAPPMGGGGGPCGWGGAVVEVPYAYYKAYGDKELLNEFFPKMLRFFDYLESRSLNGLVCSEEPGGWCLGDWLPPEPIKIPETYVNTCLYIGFMKKVIEIGKILGREKETECLAERIECSSKAVDAAYYSFQQAAYCGDINGASCLALAAGSDKENVRKKVVSKYKALGMFDTGIIATYALIGYLFDTGENQLAFELLSNEKEVSFAHMMRSGATTLWENWNGEASRNHPMFGAVTKYLFTGILGIEQADGSCGYEKVIISPAIVDGLDRASGHITTVRGKISVSYEKKDGKIRFEVFADPSIDAEFRFGEIKEKFAASAVFYAEV